MKKLYYLLAKVKILVLLLLVFNSFSSQAQMGYVPGLLHGGCQTNNAFIPQIVSNNVINFSLTPATFYTIQQDVDIVGNVLFDNIEMYVPYTTHSLTITVKSGSTLIINNSHLYGCSEMWEGIIVESGAHLIVQENSLIEDAHIAINVLPFNGTTYPVLDVFLLNKSTLNRNWIGVQITGFNLDADAPIKIINSSFTCRFIPFDPGSLSWPSFSSIRASVNTNAGFPFGSKIIDDNIFYENSTDPNIDWYTSISALPQIPTYMAGKKPLCGIQLNSCGKSCYDGIENSLNNNFSITNITDFYINIGESNCGFNLYDNLQIGLLSLGSTLRIKNSTFQNMIPDKKALPQGQFSLIGNYSGTGILADCDFVNNIEIIPGNLGKNEFNHFLDCTRGLVINNYSRMKVKHNVFESAQDLSALTNFEYDVQANPGFHYGKQGVLVQSNGYYKYELDSNSFTNIESSIIGIFKSDPLNNPFLWIPCSNASSTVHLFNFSCGVADIYENEIKALPNVFPGQFANHGIYWSAGIKLNEDWHQPVSLVRIHNNHLNNVFRPIETCNWVDSKIIVKDNLCNMLPDNVFAFSAEQVGIRLGDCQPSGNFMNEIVGNVVTIMNGNGLFNSNQEHAIKVDNSPLSYVSCNLVNNTNYGITFANTCSKSELFTNEFTNNQWSGLLLDQAVIGYNWGVPSKPADNKWLGNNWQGPGGLPNMAYAYKCSAQTAPMFVRLNLSYNPNGFCSSSSGLISDYYDFSNSSTLFPAGSNNTISTCDPGILSNPGNDATESASSLKSIVQGQNIFDSIFKNEIIAQNQINIIGKVTDFLLSNTDSTLINFIHENPNSAVTIDSIQVLSQSTFPITSFSLTPDSIYSSTQYATLEYYRIKELVKSMSFTIADSMEIVSYAFSCPKINGDIVFLYRDLLNALSHHTNAYINDCSINAARTASEVIINANNNGKQRFFHTPEFSFTLLPVPAKNNFWINISSMDKDELGYEFFIYNQLGILARHGLFNETYKEFSLGLSSGSYYLKLVKLSNNETKTQSFIVVE